MKMKICGLIPVYNNHQTIIDVIEGLLSYVDYIIVVDDGSDDGTEKKLDILARENVRVQVVHQLANQGKGCAVQRGLIEADNLGFAYAIQMDGDGQHDLSAVPLFLDAIEKNMGAIILGKPIFDDDIPFARKHGRKLTNYMMALEIGKLQSIDGNCGFRAYPVSKVCKLGSMGKRMSFDPEILVRASWAGIAVVQVPTKVRYLTEEEGGVSHFRMVRDNVLHTWLHVRLIIQAPLRWLLRLGRNE